MIRRAALLALLPLVLAVSAVSAVPAHGATWSAPDPVGDAVHEVYDPEAPPCSRPATTPVAAPDIRRLAADHRRAFVVLRMTVRGLVRGRSEALFTVRAPAAEYLVFGFGRRAEVFEVPQRAGDGCGAVTVGGQVPSCRGSSFVVRPAADLVVARVPTRCVGAPRWIRAGGAVTNFQPGEAGFDSDVWRQPRTEDAPGRWLGPRVRSGPVR